MNTLARRRGQGSGPLHGLVISYLFFSPILTGQQFVDETSIRFPPSDPNEYSSQVAIADIDGDGDLDVCFANGRGFGSTVAALQINGQCTLRSRSTALVRAT